MKKTSMQIWVAAAYGLVFLSPGQVKDKGKLLDCWQLVALRSNTLMSVQVV